MSTFSMGRVPPVEYGAGRIADAPDIVAGLGGGPVLLVADAMMADLGVVGRLEAALGKAGIACETAAEIAGEPKEPLVDALADRARRTACRTVIGLGGGAAMDAAKLVATIAGDRLPASHYALGANPLPKSGLPAIAIPTTAGTGSEVTRTAIVSTAGGAKLWWWGEELAFAHVVLDPELTLSLPAHLTAWTGIDAVAHALEAVTSRKSNASGQLYGFPALSILAEALPCAVADGGDLAARGRMLWASMVAGLALHNCNTHMGHNISHAIGSLAPVHHGLATGLALEVSLPWLVARPEGAANYARAAEALGGEAAAASLPGAFAGLMRSAGIARALPDAASGVDADALAGLMKAPANFSMSQNAACPIGEDDLDEIAAAFMALPRLENAA